jgi:hypothetical protein
MRLFALFLILFTFFSALVFGYKEITKADIKVAGKLVFAAILSAALAGIIYLGEVG